MRCDFADSFLQGYFDSELSDRRAAEFDRHLRHCVHCATELVDLDLLRDSLHLAQLYEPASASLRRRIRVSFDTITPNTAVSHPRAWRGWAAAAALLFVAIVLGRVGHRSSGHDYQTELAGEIVDAHVRSLRPGPITGVASNNERLVKDWLNRGVGFAVPVHDFANAGFTLNGARVDVIEGRAVAVLIYERNGHAIDVFVWRTREQDSPPRIGWRRDFQWLDWRKSKMEFCAVSDTGPVDLQQLQRLISSSA